MVITFVKRPTSPLDFEPVETPPEDILCPGSDQEYEYDDEKRAKKKLRVEILGRQYLEGRPLFIQSAGLRGPFEEGWINPWAGGKRKRGTNGTKRRLAAAYEEDNYAVGLEIGKADAAVNRRPPGNVRYEDFNEKSEKATSVVKRSPVRTSHSAKRRRRDSIDESTYGDEIERPVKAGSTAPRNDRNNWLKTDHGYMQAGARSSRKSPTPTSATKSRTKPVTLRPPEKAQHRRAPSRPMPDAQGIDRYGSGFTPINQRSEPKEGGIQPETTAKPLTQDPKHVEVSRTSSPKTMVEEKDLRSADERTRHAYGEVPRLSQEAAERAVKEDGYMQAKKLSQEAASRAYHSKLEPYVSEFVVTDVATSSAGLKAASRAPKPSPHAAPPSTKEPEFRYRYTRKRSSSGSSRDMNPLISGTEAIQKRARSSSSSSSDSEAFAQELEAAQAKAAAKSFGSSHSPSSPAGEGHETDSIKKNTQGLRRLTFTPSGGAKLARSRTSSRPGSNSSANGQAKRKTGDPKENDLVRKESTRSSDLGISDGTRSRDSIMFPEAQVVPNAPIQLAQSRSDPSSTNLLETDKQSARLPDLDEEGDSYLNLSTQAAFLKAQRSFKDDLSSLKSSPLQAKTGKTSPVASRYNAADVTPLVKGRRANGATSRQVFKAEENNDEEALSTQAMVDAMSPFAITTIKKRPPVLQKRTSFAPSPTKQKSPTRSPASLLSPTVNPFRRTSLSMSTSTSPSQGSPPPKSPPLPAPSNPHTPSKPPTSTLTSFSILPNGTLTETSIYQDGQQQPQHKIDWDTSLPLDPFGLTATAEGPKSSGNGTTNKQPNSLDLNAVLEDAGSFLGEWDVEAEARREGRRERLKEGGEGRRGILLDKGGSS